MFEVGQEENGNGRLKDFGDAFYAEIDWTGFYGEDANIAFLKLKGSEEKKLRICRDNAYEHDSQSLELKLESEIFF